MAYKIPIQFLDRAAYSISEAAAVLGVCRATVWRLTNLPKSDPRRLAKTSYNRIPRTEVDRHLAVETARRA